MGDGGALPRRSPQASREYRPCVQFAVRAVLEPFRRPRRSRRGSRISPPAPGRRARLVRQRKLACRETQAAAKSARATSLRAPIWRRCGLRWRRRGRACFAAPAHTEFARVALRAPPPPALSSGAAKPPGRRAPVANCPYDRRSSRQCTAPATGCLHPPTLNSRLTGPIRRWYLSAG